MERHLHTNSTRVDISCLKLREGETGDISTYMKTGSSWNARSSWSCIRLPSLDGQLATTSLQIMMTMWDLPLSSPSTAFSLFFFFFGPELPEIAECDSGKAETARKDDTRPMSLLVNNSAASSLTQFTLSHRERMALAGALIPRQEAPVEASLFLVPRLVTDRLFPSQFFVQHVR
jgi:hypothetical protein